MNGFAGVTVADPVIRVLNDGATGVVRGSGSTYAYIDVAGWVVALTGATVPPMPNGISVTQRHGLGAFERGATVEFGRGELVSQDVKVSIPDAKAWDPTLVLPGRAPHVEELGREIWRRLQLAKADDPDRIVNALTQFGFAICGDDDGRRGLLDLFASLIDRDAVEARRAVAALLGRGPGLTPEGDDFLAASAAIVHACAESCGWSREQVIAWHSALLPDDRRAKTSALSVTLLELAAQGKVFYPVQVLFAGEASDWQRMDALRALRTTGHGTGWVWAAGCAATAVLISSAMRNHRADRSLGKSRRSA